MSGNPDDRMSMKSCAIFFMPAFFATTAIILGTAGTFYCETVKFPQESGNQDSTLYASPWNYRTVGAVTVDDTVFVYNTCRSYSYLEDAFGFRYSVDATTRAVWSFSIMTPIIGALLIFVACLGPCTTVNPSNWKCMGFLFVFMALFQGLTLLVQSSSICKNNPILQYLDASEQELADTFPETCETATGFILIIVSVVCWFLAGVVAVSCPSPEVFPEAPPQEQTVTYTQNADGTVTETNVTIVKGNAVSPPEKAAFEES